MVDIRRDDLEWEVAIRKPSVMPYVYNKYSNYRYFEYSQFCTGATFPNTVIDILGGGHKPRVRNGYSQT